MFAVNNDSTSIAQSIQQAAKDLVKSLDAFQEAELWAAGVSIQDLVDAGFTAEQAQDIKTACADGNAFAALFDQGTRLSGYPDGYVYGASIRNVKGPGTR